MSEAEGVMRIDGADLVKRRLIAPCLPGPYNWRRLVAVRLDTACPL